MIPKHNWNFDRRDFHRLASVAAASAGIASAAESASFQINYMLASCLYGYLPIGEVLPEVRKTGSTAIDIWPKVHGNQREQIDELGEQKFKSMLQQHNVKLGCITQYKLGPFRLQNEMRLAKRLGAKTIVCGGVGPKGLQGSALKAAVSQFIEQLKPHLEVAEETGVTIAVENHSNNLIETPDSLRYLAELRPSKYLAIALAPYHLPQREKLLSKLILDVGDAIAVFYAWQHGMGCMQKLPKDQELLQLPGRGELDFVPLVQALVDIRYSGWTSIFMHPVPRGIPIMQSASQVTDEINRSRKYLQDCLAKSTN